jgi:hypothetical protein
VVVTEHAITDTVVDLTPAGDSAGDLLTFHDPVFSNGSKVGHDQGECIRISPAAGTWECRWLTVIDGQGQIMVEGKFADTHDTTLVVTGGTGAFRNARGVMKLSARAGGTRFRCEFHLIP